MKKIRVRIFKLGICPNKKIRIRLWLNNIPFHIEQFKSVLGVEPSVTRSVFPPGSHNKPYWYTEIESEADNIEEPLSRLASRIAPKMDLIAQLCKEEGVEAGFTVYIRSEFVDRPVMEIPASFHSIMRELNASLQFDIAYEW